MELSLESRWPVSQCIKKASLCTGSPITLFGAATVQRVQNVCCVPYRQHWWWHGSLESAKLVAKQWSDSTSFSWHSSVLLFPGMKKVTAHWVGATHSVHSGLSEAKNSTALDLASGAVNVRSWLVSLESDPEFVGRVSEMVEIGRLDDFDEEGDVQHNYLLKICEVRSQRDSDVTAPTDRSAAPIEFLVPLVDDFVRNIDIKGKSLVINPPNGLLELARRPEALRKLRPIILEFCRQQIYGISGCLQRKWARTAGKDSQVSGRLYPKSRSEHAYMPTRRQLVASGRQDLIESIVSAGGFLSVAHALRLPARRRPNGFWEDLRNLDAEIEWFVNNSWVKKADPTTGRLVYVNEVTKTISFNKPRKGDVFNPFPISELTDDIGTAAMPREKTLKDAGRYDLHHAIALHGGYRAVAQMLGRQTAPWARAKTRTKKYPEMSSVELEQEIQCFIEKKGLSRFPSVSELREEQRIDLITALYHHGGLGVVADRMGIRPKRYGKGHWISRQDAASVLQVYLLQKICEAWDTPLDSTTKETIWEEAVKAGSLRIPQESQLMKDGRSDLRYLIRKYGQRELAAFLNIYPRAHKRTDT